MIGERVSQRAATGEQTSNGNRRRALNVVVEATHSIAVARQQRDRRSVVEVLELDAAARIHLLHRHHKLLEQRVELSATRARLAQTWIERIVEELLVVGSDIDHHGHAARWMNSANRGVEREFAHGNAHAANAQIAQAEDALAIGHANDAHIDLRPIAQNVGHSTAMFEREVQPLGPPHDVAKLLTRLSNRRCVNNRHVARRIRAQQLIEEPLVSILQLGKKNVALEVIGAHRQLHARTLLLRCTVIDRVGEQPGESKQFALGLRERRALVQARVVEDFVCFLPHEFSLQQPVRDGSFGSSTSVPSATMNARPVIVGVIESASSRAYRASKMLPMADSWRHRAPGANSPRAASDASSALDPVPHGERSKVPLGHSTKLRASASARLGGKTSST